MSCGTLPTVNNALPLVDNPPTLYEDNITYVCGTNMASNLVGRFNITCIYKESDNSVEWSLPPEAVAGCTRKLIKPRIDLYH